MDFSAAEERMQWYVDQQLLSCVATVVLEGTEVVQRARFGVMNTDSREPLREDAIFRMYSNTKLVTSVALMMLVEQGRVGLDDPLTEYLPAFAATRVLKSDATDIAHTEAMREPIRLRHLLSHSAGFSYGFFEPDTVLDGAYTRAGLIPALNRDLSLAEFSERLAQMPLAYQPGSAWRYSFATDICARVVEVVSGQTFDQHLQERIFEPLQMHDTGFWVPVQKQARFTTMYGAADLMDPMAPGLPLADAPTDGLYSQEPKLKSGGGGLVSTVPDFLRFVRLIVNGGSLDGVTLLAPDTLARMRENQLAPGVGVSFPTWSMPDTMFGLGFAIKRKPFRGEPDSATGEYHWGGMAGTHTWFAPQAGIAGMCFAQRMPGFWHRFSHDFKRLVYEAVEASR